jgi:glycosyltransferase involved in cell wall biosynthesis
MPTMTVAQVLPRLQSGSAEIAALSTVRALVAAGHRAVVVSGGGRLDAAVEQAGGRHVRMDMASQYPWMMLRNALALRAMVRREGVDVLHAWGRAPAWSSWLAARLAGISFVTTYHKGYNETNPLKRIYNGVMARGDRVVAMSESIAELIHDRYGTPWDRIRVAQPDLDLSGFDPDAIAPERIEALRTAWGAEPQTRIVLLVGRLTLRKGAHVLVHAARRLKERGIRDVLCVVLGEDQDRTRYAAEIWDLILSTETADIVRFGGYCEDMPAAYAAASLMVAAAVRAEGLQIPVVEAQAMRLPVIASDLSAGPDVLLAAPRVAEDRAAGWLVKAGDEAGLAAAIVGALAKPAAVRQAMGERGRAWVEAQFIGKSMVGRLLDVYGEIGRPSVARQPPETR